MKKLLMVDIELRLDKKTAAKLNKMKRKDMLGIITALSLRNKVQDETVERLERELTVIKKRLEKAEDYVKQGKSMIDAVMNRWYPYV